MFENSYKIVNPLTQWNKIHNTNLKSTDDKITQYESYQSSNCKKKQ